MASGPESGRGNVWTSAFVAVTVVACNPVFDIHEGHPRPLCVDPSGFLIDDLEDGDSRICALSGRSGEWFDFGDGTTGAELTPRQTAFRPTRTSDGPRGTSQYAAHFSGSGFTRFGAYMGLSLQSENLPYDANTLGGIKFWMKSDTPVTVEFPTSETIPAGVGQCADSATENNCNNHFGFHVTTPAPGWSEYEVPFNALAQRPGGSATWNSRHLHDIQFQAPAGSVFDVWVDDIAFYNCATPECQPTCTDPAFPVSCRAGDGPRSSCQRPGNDCAAVATWCADPLLIDDMEDGDNAICLSDGRRGPWFATTNDPGGTLVPSEATFKPTEIPGGRGSSRYAAHLSAAGLTTREALMGVNLNAPAAKRLPYDASAADGIRFWMKSNVPIDVVFPIDATTTPDGYGGSCFLAENCENHFRFQVGSSGNRWMEYKVPFGALSQTSYFDMISGNLIIGSARWSRALITSLFFDAFVDFDIWVDDIRFYNCSPSDCLPTCELDQVPCPAAGGQPAGCWPAGTDCTTTAPFIVNDGVWGSGPSDVWVVGISTANTAGVIRHWDGSRLTTVDTEAMPPIWGVWGSGAGDVWAVADKGTVARQTGSSWSATPSGTSARLVGGVWGSASDDIWAVAYPGHLRHWDGVLWSDVPVATSDLVWDVWGTGPADVWAVGAKESALHWDGLTWNAYSSGTSHYLNAVWGSDAGDFWAVGNDGAVIHWNGSAWSEETSGTSQTLGGVWGSSPHDVWAVGAQGTIIHWGGPLTGWSVSMSGTTHDLYGVWGSASDDVWAVGAGVILHWNGVRWSPRP